MKKITVYDLPTRFFHWLFALFFLAAFIIANTIDDDSPVFVYHMILGLTILFLLVLRVIWGVIGTTYARFSSFELNPAELFRYFKETVIKKTKRYMGHNPASSYAAVLMFIFAIGLAATGIMMTSGNKTEFYEETHEILANLFLATVIAHLAGIAIHHFTHRDSLWSSMFDGKKKEIKGKAGISGTKPVAGLLFLFLVFVSIGYLNSQYNSREQTLNFFGTNLQLGENEGESELNNEYYEEEEDHDDD